jgi:hypothetical protein
MERRYFEIVQTLSTVDIHFLRAGGRKSNEDGGKLKRAFIFVTSEDHFDVLSERAALLRLMQRSHKYIVP